MIPCISNKLYKHLYSTADERYNYSKDFFRKTHYAQTLNYYYNNKLTDSFSDEDFYNELLETNEYNNRIIFILGSTGSGKSELLCWIKDKWEIEEINRPVIRISRSELNPLLLIKKCMETLGLNFTDLSVDENKWNMLLNKPITILNQIVWTTLSEFFDNDDDIVPTAMLFRPVIEKNIQLFAQQIKKGKIDRPLELISKEEFDETLESTTININIKYKRLRNSLLKNLDHFLFEGFEVKTIFKKFSEELSKRNIRPLLLIDDLVQSINLYAADLLDYFITLEEGSWDVVIGLTPGVEQDSDVNNELKERINNLDTIDDRVRKLWLSDEAGLNFYTINKEQANAYIKNYLVALKDANGYSCGDHCPYAKSCKTLLSEDSVDLHQLPFNNSSIERIYEGIPAGKGKLRYTILHMKELLKFFSSLQEKDIEKIKNYYKRDVFIDNNNNYIKFLGEFYSNPLSSNYFVTKYMLSKFQIESDGLNLKVNKVGSLNEEFLMNQTYFQPNVSRKTEEHIRDWIEGENIKEELLDPIKSGVVSLLGESVSGHNFMKEHTSRAIKSKSTLQRSESIKGYKYPFSFNPTKEKNSLHIEKRINLLSIANLQQTRTQDRWKLFNEISNDYNVSQFIYEGEFIKNEWRKDLTEGLGIELDIFSFQLKNYMAVFLSLEKSEWLPKEYSPFPQKIQDIVEGLYLDMFSLRDNMIDYNRISYFKRDSEFEQWVLSFIPPKKLNKYSLNNIPLQAFLLELQTNIIKFYEQSIPILKEKVEEYKKLDEFILSHSKYHHELLSDVETLKLDNHFKVETLLKLDGLVNWLSTLNENDLKEWEKQKSLRENLSCIFTIFEEESELTFDIKSVEDAKRYLKNDLKIRKQVSHHIINMIEHGRSQLPKKQWRGILRDLYESSPDLFEKVTVELSIRK